MTETPDEFERTVVHAKVTVDKYDEDGNFLETVEFEYDFLNDNEEEGD